MSDFQGEPTRILENEHVKLEYLANSARIVRFYPLGRDNLFAEMERMPVSTPYGDFFFRGGRSVLHFTPGRSPIGRNQFHVSNHLADLRYRHRLRSRRRFVRFTGRRQGR